jgi:hypothetical protein
MPYYAKRRLLHDVHCIQIGGELAPDSAPQANPRFKPQPRFSRRLLIELVNRGDAEFVSSPPTAAATAPASRSEATQAPKAPTAP